MLLLRYTSCSFLAFKMGPGVFPSLGAPAQRHECQYIYLSIAMANLLFRSTLENENDAITNYTTRQGKAAAVVQKQEQKKHSSKKKSNAYL